MSIISSKEAHFIQRLTIIEQTVNSKNGNIFLNTKLASSKISSFKWAVLTVANFVFSPFGYDGFSHVRIQTVSNKLFCLLKSNREYMTEEMITRIQLKIIIPLNERSKGKYYSTLFKPMEIFLQQVKEEKVELKKLEEAISKSREENKIRNAKYQQRMADLKAQQEKQQTEAAEAAEARNRSGQEANTDSFPSFYYYFFTTHNTQYNHSPNNQSQQPKDHSSSSYGANRRRTPQQPNTYGADHPGTQQQSNTPSAGFKEKVHSERQPPISTSHGTPLSKLKEVFQVDAIPDEKTLNRLFRFWALKNHPDKFVDETKKHEAQELFKQVNQWIQEYKSYMRWV